MSASKSPVPDTDATMSEPNAAETNQLKRKALGTSPDPDESGSGDAPSKRPKIVDVPGQGPEPEDRSGRDGDGTTQNGTTENGTTKNGTTENGTTENGTTENGNKEHQALPRRKSRSPDTRRAVGHADRKPSPEEWRRPSEPRRQDARSPSGPPDRRGSESGRRTSSSFGVDKERDRRESVSKEEKKRGRRLFGGLLSTLSQTTTNSQQKRRLEIEKRQQEKAAQQTREDDKRRSEKLAKLERIRKIEQVRFDEQVMRTRHSNMLAMAHSLRTSSEPRLYYRPWELSPEKEDVIRDQVRDAESQMEEEVQQFKRRKEQRLKDLGALPSSPEVEATVGEQVEEHPNNAAPVESTPAATATNDRKPSPAPAQKSSHHEDRDHDEMVEAEEDTVIY